MTTNPADEGPDGPPLPDPDELVQMNVRVPRSLRDELDERRGRLDLSRDRWVVNALRWALKQPGRPQRTTRKTVSRTGRGKSIKPATGGKR